MSVLTLAEVLELRAQRDRLSVLLNAAENGTLNELERLENADGEGVFARDLARVLGISHSAANMRLERLFDAGFVTRRSVRLVNASGGRAWRYALSRDSVEGVCT